VSKRVTVLDGGMGRELLRIGAPFRQPEWSALALTEGPEWVVQAHTNFIDAGADVITTNSYAIVPFHIGEHRFAAEGRELAALAGRLAQQAATRASTPPVVVAGCLPPLFGSYRPELFDADDAPRLIDPLVNGLAEHVDIWLGETLGSIGEAQAVRDALHRADRADARPLWISYALNDDYHRGVLHSGEPVTDAIAAAIDLGATAVLFNCSQAATITAAIDIAAGIAGDEVSIGGYANRFLPPRANNVPADHVHANEDLSALRDDLDPISYRAVVARWIADGATIVGGCCGIEPAHIAELAALASTINT